MSKASTLSSARRYSTALLRVATSSNNVTAVADACRDLQKLIEHSPILTNAIKHQGLSSEQKGTALLEIAKKQHTHEIVCNLIHLLKRNRRLHLLPAILTQVDKDSDTLAGVVDAVASAPVALNTEQIQVLQKTIANSTGSVVRLHTTVDPRLLDGITIRVGGRFYDASGLTKIRRLRQAMEVL